MAAFGSMCSRHLRQMFSSRTWRPRRPILLHILSQRNMSNRSSVTCIQVWNRNARFTGHSQSLMLCVPTPAIYQQGRWFSSDYTPQKGSKITEEILKAKIGATDKGADTSTDSKADEEKSEKKKDKWYSGKNAWKLGLLSLAGMGLMLGTQMLVLWGAPLLDKDGQEVIDEFSILPSWKAYPKRAFREFQFFKKSIVEPSSRQLLPDPVKEPYYQPPYTLVLEMTDVLVHPDWTLSTGWRFKKRPGIDFFLSQVSQPLFEVVIYTKEQGMTAFPIIDGMDPNGFIHFRLFRDATRYTNGHHVKDLGCLNRDLKKVIIVDCDHRSFQLQPRNAVLLKKWKGNDDDRTLVDLAQFLRTVASSGVDDVRTVLEYYSQFDEPLEVFKANQAKLQEEQEKAASEKVEASKQKSLAGSWSMGLYGRRKGT